MSSKDLVVYTTFEDFYKFYLKEHTNRTNKRLHFIGTSLALLTFAYIFLTGSYRLLYLPFLLGYGCAWVGHFFFEKNKPATFKYPWFSFRGDLKLYFAILTGKIKF